MSFVYKGIAAGTVVALAMLMVGESSAGAGTVSASYQCGSITGGTTGVGPFQVTINAPANAGRGQTVTVTASIAQTQNYGNHVAAGSIRINLDIILGGAASDTIVATGLTNPEIQPDTPWRVTGGTVRTTLNTVGDVTYRPSTFREVSGAWGCWPPNGTSPVAATTHVS
jgi:hypothetical protein